MVAAPVLAAAPVAQDTFASVRESSPASIDLNGLAQDDDFDPLTFAITNAPDHGAFTGDCTDDGICTYTPTAAYIGSDSFQWTANDGTTTSNVATYSIDVTANNAPIATDQSANVVEDTATYVYLDVYDPDFDDLTITITDPPDHGSLDGCSFGTCLYTPTTGYTGPDAFLWQAGDGLALSAIATVTLTIEANVPPVAVNGSVTALAGGSRTIILEATDDDPFASLTFTIIDTPDHGTLDDCSSGTCAYTADAGYTGPDAFTWKANDGVDDSNTATTSITVTEPLGTVLILDSTVTGGLTSREAQAATDLGYAVEVVDDTGWGAKSASAFGSYAALVLGDPTCSGIDQVGAAIANRTTWGPTVDGNVVIIGTDPVFHEGQGGGELTDRGVAFALDEAGKTGLYATLSCYYDGASPATGVELLEPFGAFSVASAECFNDSHIVAVHPALTGLDDADLSNWSCSVHEVFDSWPLDFLVLAIAESFGAVYTAPDGSVGSPYILARGEDLTVLSDIALSPASAENPIGAMHTLTATVTESNAPVVGTTVTFTVVSGPCLGSTGTDATDASGIATFGYTCMTTGTDTIKATFVDSDTKTQTSNLVTKTWVEAPDNPAPTSDAGGPYAGTEGSPISLNGTVSNEPAGDTVTQTWSYTLGAGTDAGMTCAFLDATAVDTDITCTDDGSVTVKLTVSDGVNTPATEDTAVVTIANANPTVDITAPAAAASFETGVTVNLSGTISDAGSNDTHTCSIDWGDGATTTGTVASGTCTGSHTYSSTGPKTITVTVTDDDTGQGIDTVGITITAPPVNPAPTSDAGGPYSGDEGSAISLNGTVTNEPGTDTVTQTWSYTLGAGTDAGMTCSFGNANNVDTTITCTDDGSVTVKLTVSDGVNTPATEDTAVVTIANADPTVDITAPADLATVNVGATVDLSASRGDPGSNDTHTCSIDWGDGTTTTGTLTATTCTGSHAYASIGVPTITVTVTDDDGGSDIDSIMLVVAEAQTKVTGGGWITLGDGRLRFGLVATPDGAGAKGEIQVRWGKHRFHGKTVTGLVVAKPNASWSGSGRYDGDAGYTYEVTVVDNGNGGGKNKTPDSFAIVIRDGGGAVVFSTSGSLGGGNLKIH